MNNINKIIKLKAEIKKLLEKEIMEGTGMKKCRKCKGNFELTQFNKKATKSNPKGINAWCKICIKQKNKTNYFKRVSKANQLRHNEQIKQGV